MKRYVIAAVAATGLLLGLAGTAGAATVTPKPDVVSNSVDVITNNGVAGAYSDSGGSAYKDLCFKVQTTSASDNMVLGADGIGGQLGNASTGEVAGSGLERTGANTFGVFYGWGFLHGDAGALFGNNPFFDPDANPLLGGILPTGVHGLALTSPIRTGDTVQICEHQYTVRILNRRVHHKTTRFRVAVQAKDLAYGDTTSAVMAIGTGNPWFGQAGVGSQRSLANLSSPAQVGNPLANFTDISNVPYWSFSYNDFGCPDVTTLVNSASNSNAGAGAEPNPYAQLDTVTASGGGVSGGCGTEYGGGASLTVYTGNPNS